MHEDRAVEPLAELVLKRSKINNKNIKDQATDIKDYSTAIKGFRSKINSQRSMIIGEDQTKDQRSDLERYGDASHGQRAEEQCSEVPDHVVGEEGRLKYG